jgi:ABC-type transport system substrate-binding protein
MDKRFSLIIMAAAVIILGVVLISGCTSPTPTATPNATATPTPITSKNFSIVEMNTGEAGSLDPASSDGYDTASQEIVQQVYETPFYYNGSDASIPVPLLATSYDVSADGLTYTIHLRTGVKFHSGDALDANAAKHSLDRLLLVNNQPASNNFLGTIKGYSTYYASNNTQADVDAYLAAGGVTVVDNNTVTIALEHVTPDLIKMLTFDACSIINPNFDRAHGGYNATGQVGTAYLVEHEDGTGPFILDHWTHKQEIGVKRNENYWGTKALPSMVYIRNVDDWNTRLLALQNADADIVQVLQTNAPDVQNDSRFVVETKYGALTTNTIEFNENMYPFNITAVRQANRRVVRLQHVHQLADPRPRPAARRADPAGLAGL